MHTNEPAIDPDNVIGRRLAETELLIEFLKPAEIGQVFTYQQMSEAAKEDVLTRNTILQTARRTLMKPPHRMVFGTLPGVGIKRLSDEDIPMVGISATKRAAGTARRGMKALVCADARNMEPETRIRYFTTRTILGLFTTSGSRKSLGLAEQAVRAKDDALKIGDFTKLFSK
jgi:hypothetical protein